MTNTVHVHAPPATRIMRRVFTCEQCGKRRVHAVFCYDWYDPIAYCATCGREHGRGRYVRKTPDLARAKRAREALAAERLALADGVPRAKL